MKYNKNKFKIDWSKIDTKWDNRSTFSFSPVYFFYSILPIFCPLFVVGTRPKIPDENWSNAKPKIKIKMKIDIEIKIEIKKKYEKNREMTQTQRII